MNEKVLSGFTGKHIYVENLYPVGMNKYLSNNVRQLCVTITPNENNNVQLGTLHTH